MNSFCWTNIYPISIPWRCHTLAVQDLCHLGLTNNIAQGSVYFVTQNCCDSLFSAVFCILAYFIFSICLKSFKTKDGRWEIHKNISNYLSSILSHLRIEWGNKSPLAYIFLYFFYKNYEYTLYIPAIEKKCPMSVFIG